ncbi:MAG: alpha/beta hydrolase [Gammaproteobacteria bacterium]|nr:alpha/beta hydrolase [Gammaproteobacteria bacterium]
MKKTLLLLVLLLTVPAFGEDYWSHRVSIDTDVPYGEDSSQVADIYTQGQRVGEPTWFVPSDKPRPTLLWIHGGGWVAGDKSSQFPHTVHFLEQGWDVVNINYRQGPGTAPLAVDDVMCAYTWTVEHAREIGASPDRIVVSGASAGGHLALMVGLLNSTGSHPCRANTPPLAVVNWYGITDIEVVESYLAQQRPRGNYALSWIGAKNRIAKISADYSPMSHITDDAPPIITIHGTDDSVVPYDQAEALHSSLSTPNRLVTLTDGKHGGFSDTQYQEAMASIFEFLAEND